MQRSHNLNEVQKKAIHSTEGPLLILAGAGAGKTRVITERILHLIKNGTAPSEILAITFTNKAAREMKDRVISLLKKDMGLNLPVSFSEQPFVSTFHSLGVHLIRENAAKINLRRNFTIFDRSDSLRALRESIKESFLDTKQWEPGRMLSLISRFKGDGLSLDDYRGKATENYLDRTLLVIWEKYEGKLRAEKALDFDDLLLSAFSLLKNNPAIREHYQRVWRYIHIDEYQDTNRVQYDMAKLLAEKNKNICVVGDIDQSIYSWRGADFKNVMRFEKDYPEAKVVTLEENYRSTKKILRAANDIIVKNTLRREKNLFTKNPAGESITLHGTYDEGGEAAFVAEKISRLLENKVPAKEIAVLYRANFQSRILEEACLLYKIPYEVLGVRFFERAEVKDILSYLRAALNPDSLADVKRVINVPPRGIGKVTIAKVFAGAEGKLPPKMRQKISEFRKILSDIRACAEKEKLSEVVQFIIRRAGIKKHFEAEGAEGEERLGNIFELAAVAERYDFLPPKEAIENFLTDAALASDQDDMKENRDSVKLMTVHAAKGLEFDCVFITGLEEDLFPYVHPDNSKKNLEEAEEERRLFYVALTRARKKIFLSYASVRNIFGSRVINIPSSFIDDIAPEILESELGHSGETPIKTIFLD